MSLSLLATTSALADSPFLYTYPGKDSLRKGVFLVATSNLDRSSFRETVILLTHFSFRGSTGIAINRPSKIRLQEAFPDVKELKNSAAELYLGGPVRSDTVFVLMKTDRPHAGMHEISKDLFFTRGIDAIVHSNEKLKSGEHTRAYAGYTGWAPGQLEAEIARGDWRIVPYDTDIVFDSDMDSVWLRLYRKVSGQWI